MKRTTFLESLRRLLPSMPQLAPAGGGMQVQFASAGGGGGGRRGDDDYPDDDYYEDEFEEEEEPAPVRERRSARPTAARQRTVQTDPDDRYWTDYLRIALPVIGLLLVIAVFWYWAQQLIDSDSDELSPTAPGLAEIVDTPVEATEAPATPTAPAGNILQPQTGGTPSNPLQAIPSPTPASQQPPAQQQPAETQVATEQAPAAGGIAPDTQVTVTDGPLNMRAEANTTSDIVTTLETGAVLDVLSGPQEGEGFTWWNVVDEQGNNGWVVQEFIAPAT